MKDLADVTTDLMVDSQFRINRGGSPHAAYFGVSGVFEACVPDALAELRRSANTLHNFSRSRAVFTWSIRQVMLANNDFAKNVLDVLRHEKYVTEGRLMTEVYLKTSNEASNTPSASTPANSDGESNTGLVILAVAGVVLIVLCMCKNVFGG